MQRKDLKMRKDRWIRIAILTVTVVAAFAASSVCVLHCSEPANTTRSAFSDNGQTWEEQIDDSDLIQSLTALSKKARSVSRQSALHEVLRIVSSVSVDRTRGPETAQEPVAVDDAPTPLAAPDESEESPDQTEPAGEAVGDDGAPAETASEPEDAVPQQEQPAETEADTEEQQTAPEEQPQTEPAEEQQADMEEPEEEEVPDTEYGTPTGNWGCGNQWKNVQWVEYEKDGNYTIVCSVVDRSLGGERNAMIRLLNENGSGDTSVKAKLQGRVTKIVIKKGITGIGWTYLNAQSTSSNYYEPSWPNEASDPDVTYSVNSGKTDTFNGFTKLKTVVPCSTIERIGWSAFRKCNSLSDFDFKKCPHLKEILNQAFNPCPALNNIDLSACNELTVIGWSAFNGSATGRDVTLQFPSNGRLSIIGGNSFNPFGKSASTFTADFSGVASSLTQIQRGAFNGAHIAGDLSCLDHLTMLGNNALQNTNITGVQISPDMTTFPSNAFSGCGNIEKIVWASSSYGGSLNGSEFSSSNGFELTIGGNVTKLPKNFFKTVKAASDVFFEGVPGGHVISIKSDATAGGAQPFTNISRSCYVDEHGVVYELTGNDKARVVYCPPGLSEYTVPAEITTPAAGSASAKNYIVTAIAPYAFTKARNLKTISFEDAATIQSVGDSAFYGIGSLTKVVDLGTDPSTVARTAASAKAIFTGISEGSSVPDTAFEKTGLRIYMMVRYNVKEAKPVAGSTLDGSLPGTIGDAAINDLASDAKLTVDDLRSHYYRTARGSRLIHFPYYTYIFRGWRSESGALVQPGDEIVLNDTDSAGNRIYDKDGDGCVVLTSEWVGTWKPNSGSTGTPSANFSIWTNVSSANSSIDENKFLSEQVVNYSPKINNAIMYALDGDEIIYPDELMSPAVGGKGKYNMITYVGSTILEADKNVRQLADTGFTATDPRNGEVHWKISYLPSDEEVLQNLAEMTEAGEVDMKDENGAHIPAEELTTENFVVRWCCAKYQSGDADGWNMNAKLTRKLSYIAVTKTFSGDKDAIEEAIAPQAGGRDPFNITLTSAADPNKVITLQMKDRTLHEGELSAAAISHGKLEQKDQYGYIQVIHDDTADTDKYLWIVACDEPDNFSVKENNYSVKLGGVSYGMIAQYNQLNTGFAADAEVRQWTNRTKITTQSQPSDDIVIDRFEITNFYNEYVAKDTFIIENYDDAGVVMPNVAFSVFDENGEQLKLNAAANSSAHNRRYSVLLDEGKSSNTVLTGTDGVIRLTLPQKTDRTHTYTIRQTIPDGHIGAGAVAEFSVAVDVNGIFTVKDASGPKDFGSVTALKGDSENTYGAKVINASEKTDVVVTKSWQDGLAPEDSVGIDLIRTVGDLSGTDAQGASEDQKSDDMRTLSGTVESIMLTADEQWMKTIRKLPLMSGNKPVSYSVRETRIGDDIEGSAAYDDWTQTISADDSDAHKISLRLLNEHAQDITVTLHKIDSSTDASLKDAVFRVYKRTDSAYDGQPEGSTVTFKGVTCRTAAPVDITTSDIGLADLTLRTNHTYYVEEFSAPNGYESLGVFMELTVDGNGEVSVAHDTKDASYVVCSAGNRRITVKNDPLSAPPPNNYAPIIIPFLCIALAALLLLGVRWLRRRSSQ